MGRVRAINPKIPLKIYLSEEVTARLKLASFSEYRGKVLYGQQSQIVEDALTAYLNQLEQSQCSPPKPNPESQPSDSLDSSES